MTERLTDVIEPYLDLRAMPNNGGVYKLDPQTNTNPQDAILDIDDDSAMLQEAFDTEYKYIWIPPFTTVYLDTVVTTDLDEIVIFAYGAGINCRRQRRNRYTGARKTYHSGLTTYLDDYILNFVGTNGAARNGSIKIYGANISIERCKGFVNFEELANVTLVDCRIYDVTQRKRFLYENISTPTYEDWSDPDNWVVNSDSEEEKIAVRFRNCKNVFIERTSVFSPVVSQNTDDTNIPKETPLEWSEEEQDWVYAYTNPLDENDHKDWVPRLDGDQTPFWGYSLDLSSDPDFIRTCFLFDYKRDSASDTYWLPDIISLRDIWGHGYSIGTDFKVSSGNGYTTGPLCGIHFDDVALNQSTNVAIQIDSPHGTKGSEFNVVHQDGYSTCFLRTIKTEGYTGGYELKVSNIRVCHTEHIFDLQSNSGGRLVLIDNAISSTITGGVPDWKYLFKNLVNFEVIDTGKSKTILYYYTPSGTRESSTLTQLYEESLDKTSAYTVLWEDNCTLFTNKLATAARTNTLPSITGTSGVGENFRLTFHQTQGTGRMMTIDPNDLDKFGLSGKALGDSICSEVAGSLLEVVSRISATGNGIWVIESMIGTWT